MIEPPSPSAIRCPTSDAEPERALEVDADDLVEQLLAGLRPSDGATGDMPALLTRMSTLPNSA